MATKLTMCRTGNAQFLAVPADFAVAKHTRAALGRQSARNPFMLDAHDTCDEGVPVRGSFIGEFAVLCQCERQRTPFACIKPDDDGAVAHRREGAPRIADAVRGEADTGDSTGQVEVAAIVIDIFDVLRDVLEMHPETAQRQEALAVRTGDELVVDELLRFFLAPFINAGYYAWVCDMFSRAAEAPEAESEEAK